MDINPSTKTNGAYILWTQEEDAKLIGLVASIPKKEGRLDWVAVAKLVPSRKKVQCYQRWRNKLKPSIAPTGGRTGKWDEEEDTKLKDAVQALGGKNWKKIATLVPSRTAKHCSNRWQTLSCK